MGTFLTDLRYAARALTRMPGFTAVAALTLALGVGANTAIFSVVYGVLLRPLGVTEPERLVFLFQTNLAEGRTRSGTSPANFNDWRAETQSFDGLTAFIWESVTLQGDQEAEELGACLMVSANFFSVLGIEPAAGRTFRAEDEVEKRRGQVTVISHALWQRRWGGDPGAIGRKVRLDGEAYEIVGVMPPGVDLPQGAVDLWIPQDFDPENPSMTRRLVSIGRLGDGVGIEQAQAEMSLLSERLAEVYPEYRNWDVTLVPAHEWVVGRTRPAILVAFGAVGLVLLIACANMANLLLARAAVREREMATRRALGASRRRILRQVLTESGLLAILGGGLGVLLALAGHQLLIRLSPGILPRLGDVRLDLPVLGFAAAVSLATGMVFGLAPALHATGVNLGGALAEGGRGAAGSRRFRRARTALVVAQVAVAVTLLAGAGLLLRSLWGLTQVDPGFRAEGAVAARIGLDDAAYPDNDAEGQYFERLLERLRAQPGMRAAGVVSGLPMDPLGIDFAIPYEAEGQSFGEDEQRSRADFRVASSGYFASLGVPLLSGRDFDDRDGKGKPVTIVNQTMARQVWPGENPIGRRLTIYFSGRDTYEVVGVVDDVKFRGLSAEPRPEMYLPLARAPFGWMTVVARTDGDAAALIPTLRREALAIDPAQPIHSAFTVAQLVANSTADSRFYAVLLGCFAAVALALSAAGIYGVITYWVNRRTREIGLRMALGADRGAVVGIVLGRGLAVTAIGLVVGVAGAFATTRLLADMLFGVGPMDPLVLAAVAVVLAAVAVAACYLPARRASRLAPTEALRFE